MRSKTCYVSANINNIIKGGGGRGVVYNGDRAVFDYWPRVEKRGVRLGLTWGIICGGDDGNTDPKYSLHRAVL